MPRRSAARAGMALILVLAAIVLAGGLALYLQTRAAALSRAEQAELVQERLRLAASEGLSAHGLSVSARLAVLNEGRDEG